MKNIILLLGLISCLIQGVRAGKYTDYGSAEVLQILDGGYLVEGHLKKQVVYVEKHKLWKSADDIGEGDRIYIYVLRDGYYSYETVAGASKSVKKYLYRGDKERSKIKKAGDVQKF